MKTYSAKPQDITRVWYELDASKAPLGRIASAAASLLLGKGKPNITAHMDGGDYVIIVNSDSLVVTGDKRQSKEYFRHSGFPGGLYRRNLDDIIKRDSRQAIIKAVYGMLPDNKLRDGRMARLKVYTGSEHGQAAQKPRQFSLNAKGKKEAR